LDYSESKVQSLSFLFAASLLTSIRLKAHYLHVFHAFQNACGKGHSTTSQIVYAYRLQKTIKGVAM